MAVECLGNFLAAFPASGTAQLSSVCAFHGFQMPFQGPSGRVQAGKGHAPVIYLSTSLILLWFFSHSWGLEESQGLSLDTWAACVSRIFNFGGKNLNTCSCNLTWFMKIILISLLRDCISIWISYCGRQGNFQYHLFCHATFLTGFKLGVYRNCRLGGHSSCLTNIPF